MVLKIQMTKVIAKILQWDCRNWEIHAFPFVLRVTRKKWYLAISHYVNNVHVS